jgi:hypothetical protein
VPEGCATIVTAIEVRYTQPERVLNARVLIARHKRCSEDGRSE